VSATLIALALLAADPGTAMLPVMKIGQGPRASAMGEAFTGLADDASTIYWNPGGLGQLRAQELGFSHHQWFADIKDEVLHAALPLGPGALGLGLIYSGEPDVQYWDEAANQFTTFTAWNAMLSAGYGLRLGSVWRVGLAAKGMYQDLKLEHAAGAAVDAGAVVRPLPWLGLGVSARHLGTMSVGSAYERVPMEAAAGAGLTTRFFKATLDAAVPFLDNDPNFRGGVEFTPVPMLALRAGYRTGPVSLTGLGFANGLTAGLGITAGNFGIDYAFVPYGELGVTHRFGIRTAFAPAAGDLVVTICDKETKERLVADVSVFGSEDTSAQADQVALWGARPGRVIFHAVREKYHPATDTFRIIAGRTLYDTMLLARVRSGLEGGIYDARTRQPIGGTLYYAGPITGALPVPSAPGTFRLVDIPEGQYSLAVSGPTDDYLPQSCTLDLPEGETVKRDFYLWRKGDFLVLEGVNFETGKADLLPDFYPVLARAGEILKQTPYIRLVELAGHTDPRDIYTTEFPSNWELSRARADAVRDYLVERLGIAPDRLTTHGYADTEPVASNATPEGMALNRRTEMRIIE